jgi:hypothetical protein
VVLPEILKQSGGLRLSSMFIGEIRLIPQHREFGRAALAVTIGPTDWKQGAISLADAESLVVAGEATWMWRDDRAVEAAQPTQQSGEPPPEAA